MLIDLSCPVENRGVSVRTNSQTQENYLLLKLLNISEKNISSLEFNLKVFDGNGTEIATLPVEFSELSAQPKEFFAENKAISISDIPDGKNFIVEITRATFEDGETYEPSEENTVDYDDSEASLQDALLIRELIPDAVCFSSEHEDYWRCACGRPNFKDAENCVRCGRKKETILNGYSSKSALEKTFVLIEEEKAQLALEEEQKKVEKKKTAIKKLITAAIIVVSVAVVFVIGFFARIGIVNILASNAAKDGDFLKSYELYKKVNSSKIGEVTDEVIGNTPSNLMFGTGFLAEDDENLYYITRNAYSEPANLIKENKKTGEKTILTDAAYACLNVVGDYIYFINNESLPCRMTKDAKTTETLIDNQMYYMCVLGSDMYYLKTDYDNPKGYTEEELEILVSQGQIATHTRIYKLDVNTKKNTKVSDEDVYMFSIYGNKIYFVTPTQTEDPWAMANLKSMNFDGSDVASVVDSPVNSFFVKDGILYYISCFDESAKGSDVSDMSSFNYSVVSLDLNTGTKKTISEKTDLVLDMNISNDSLIMLTYNRDEFFAYYSSDEEPAEEPVIPVSELKAFDFNSGKITTLVKEDAVSLNICGDNIFAVLANGNIAKYSTEISSFKAIGEDGATIDDSVFAPVDIAVE